MSQLLTPEECVLVLCYRSDEAYIKLLRGGAEGGIFQPETAAILHENRRI